jgi:hypothetical protein
VPNLNLAEVRSEAVTAGTMKVTAFRDVASYSLVCRYQYVCEERAAFGSTLKLEAGSSFLQFFKFIGPVIVIYFYRKTN